MIDEELYVLATQELNSDSRREDLWARAIALASDDHDEARYLYTNLRVEELVKERKTSERGDSDLQLELEEPSSIAGSPKLGEEPSSENLDFEKLSAQVAATSSGAQSDVSKLQRKAEELNNQLHGKTLGDDANATQNTDSSNLIESGADGDSTLETEPLPESGSSPDSALEHDKPGHDSKSQAERRITNQTGLFIDGNNTSHDSTSDLTNAGDDLDELERTEPEGFDLSDSSLDMTSPDNLPPVQVSPDPYQPLGRGAAPDGEQNFIEEDSAAVVEYEDKHPLLEDDGLPTATIDRFNAPIEPVLHSGRAFNVLKHQDGSRRAIKIGPSLPAMLFTFPWLVYKRLWGTALVYLVMGAVLLFGVVSTGLNWLDAGADATLQQKLIFGAFVLLALIGMFYLPFKQGNQWVVQRLRRKGFADHTKINAQTAKDALDLARE